MTAFGLAKEPHQRGAVVDPQRAIDGVLDHSAGVNSQGMEDGCAQVVRADGIIGRIGGPAFGGTKNGAATHSGSGQDGRVAMRPVLTAAAADDPRRAAEFADPDDERLIEHAATVEVFEQRREPLVGRGHQAVLELIEVVAVGVPEVLAVVVPVDCHQADARLDQPPRQ